MLPQPARVRSTPAPKSRRAADLNSSFIRGVEFGGRVSLRTADAQERADEAPSPAHDLAANNWDPSSMPAAGQIQFDPFASSPRRQKPSAYAGKHGLIEQHGTKLT